MPNRQDILADRRFWATLFAEMLGQISEPAEPDVVYSLLGVSGKDSQNWFDDVMGWTSDAAYGDVVPVTISASLANGYELVVEFALGDICWNLRDSDRNDARLGSIGGHWELPGLRWEEVTRIANAAPDPAWLITLLLLPMVWLTDGDDGRAIRNAVVSAWQASSFVSSTSAAALADSWLKAVEGGRNFGWRHQERGWVCSACWSTRGQQRDASEIEQINRIIEAASSSAV